MSVIKLTSGKTKIIEHTTKNKTESKKTNEHSVIENRKLENRMDRNRNQIILIKLVKTISHINTVHFFYRSK